MHFLSEMQAEYVSCCYALTCYGVSIFRLYLDSATTFFIGSSALIHFNGFIEITEICKDLSTGGGEGSTAAEVIY